MKILIMALMVLFLSGCSHFKHGPVELADQLADQSAKKFTVSEGKSNIFVIFMGGYSSSYRNFPVTVDGIQYGFLSDGTFMRITVLPGNHTIVSSSPENQQMVEIESKAGNNYFFSIVSEIAFRDLQVKLKEIDQEEGKNAVINANLVRMPKFSQSSP